MSSQELDAFLEEHDHVKKVHITKIEKIGQLLLKNKSDEDCEQEYTVTTVGESFTFLPATEALNHSKPTSIPSTVIWKDVHACVRPEDHARYNSFIDRVLANLIAIEQKKKRRQLQQLAETEKEKAKRRAELNDEAFLRASVNTIDASQLEKLQHFQTSGKHPRRIYCNALLYICV